MMQSAPRAYGPRLNFAAMVFIGVTLYLTWSTDGWSALASLYGAGFLVGGSIAAGLVVGATTTWLHRQLAGWLIARSSAEAAEPTIRSTGTALMLMQFLAVYYLTGWAYTRWLSVGPGA